MAAKSTKTTTPEPVENHTSEILEEYLKHKDNISKHYNFIEDKVYKVSTGSLTWDLDIGGGLPPGLHRFCGPPESGKSSAALEICRNFLAMHPNGRGIYIDAECKLNSFIRERSGLKFTSDPSNWRDGEIFVLQSNNFDFVVNLLRRLIKQENQPNLFCIVFDSMDALVRDCDKDKDFGDNVKVAGAALLTKNFLQTMANVMTKNGHLVLMLSQFSSNIQISQYVKEQDARPKQGGGGWAAAHFANFAFVFHERRAADFLRPDMQAPQSPKNRAYGKLIRVGLMKAPNEKTGGEILYPVKHGAKGCSSVWRAYELVDNLIMYNVINARGAWIDIPSIVSDRLDKESIKIPEKFQGRNRLIDWLDANERAVDILTEYMRNKVLGGSLDKPATIPDESKETEF